MSRENTVLVSERFKDGDYEEKERRRRWRNIRPLTHPSPLASSSARARYFRRPFTAAALFLFCLWPTGRPPPLTKTNGAYLFRGTPASGFLLSPLCIALVKHFFAFFFPFIPLFVSALILARLQFFAFLPSSSSVSGFPRFSFFFPFTEPFASASTPCRSRERLTFEQSSRSDEGIRLRPLNCSLGRELAADKAGKGVIYTFARMPGTFLPCICREPGFERRPTN